MQKTVTYWEILKIKRASFCIITVIFALTFSVFFEPFMSDHLTSLGFKSSNIGYLFAIFATAYTISAFLVGPMSKRISSRYISFISYMVVAFACTLYGPSNIYLKNDCKERFEECLSKSATIEVTEACKA
jgi:sugar phosphate permease